MSERVLVYDCFIDGEFGETEPRMVDCKFAYDASRGRYRSPPTLILYNQFTFA